MLYILGLGIHPFSLLGPQIACHHIAFLPTVVLVPNRLSGSLGDAGDDIELLQVLVDLCLLLRNIDWPSHALHLMQNGQVCIAKIIELSFDG